MAITLVSPQERGTEWGDMIALDITGVLEQFPAFRVALVLAVDLEVPATRPPLLAQRLDEVEAETAAALQDRALADLEALQVWRAAYKAFGVKKTSYRSSVERLLKQIQQGRGLPRINTLVDSYNAISVRHRLPVGADDLEQITGPLAFRHAGADESFQPLGGAPGLEDPPKVGEIVYADARKVLCRRWNWYQDARSATTPATRRAVLTVQWLGGGVALEPAVSELCTWLAEHCGARTTAAIAERGRPRAALDHQ